MAQSIQTVRAASATGTLQKSRFRADIQGLRAMAVVAVILDHLLHWPTGGFIGVDVFFVISGFMITSILLREQETTGRISFWGFYKRRVKRLLPASVLTIALTAAAAWLIFSKARATETLWDALAAFLFSSNWRFASAGTDYFQQDVPPSPLQHFWSLGVEEQFYFVWPFLLAAIFYVGGRGRRGVLFAGFVLSAVIAASMAWSFAESAANPTWAYFSTASRTWELGAGALLAVCAGAFHRLPEMVRPVLAWLGLAGIGASLFVVTPASTFPAPWAILPVVSTVLVIAANIGGNQRTLGLITNRMSVYIGNISFSLYLWHFPVIIFTTAFLPVGDLATLGVIVALIAMLAMGSYHGVEDPLRKADWRFRKPVRAESRERMKLIALCFLAVVTACVVSMALLKNAPTEVPRAVKAPSVSESAAPQSPLTLSIETALTSAAWPELSPSIGEVGTNSKAPELGAAGCLNPTDLRAGQCTFDSKGNLSAIVVGDSIAISWLPGVRSVLEPAGYSVQGIGFSNCPFAAVEIDIQNDPETSKRCNEAHSEVYAEIKAAGPDLIIISDAVAGIVNLASGAKGLPAQEEWSRGLLRGIQESQPGPARVVVLSPNPTGKAVTECYNNFSRPIDCESPISDAWKQKNAADELGARLAGATYMNTSQWFCSGERCPIFADGAPIRWDGMHLTEAYAKKLAPQLSSVLLPTAS
jgi:peptidoglycan/LPS O-acetylase OafA/YrhL